MMWEELCRMAESYLPQWHPDPEDPDIGSVIAQIYAEILSECREQYEQMTQKAHKELLYLSGIRRLFARPAKTILVAEVDKAAADGVRLLKGTRFFGEAEEKETPVSFHTEEEILAVYANLTDILYLSEQKRCIIGREKSDSLFPVSLFQMEGENLYKEELIIGHGDMLREPLRLPAEAFFTQNGRKQSENRNENRDLCCTKARLKSYGANIRPQLIHDGTKELSTERTEIFGQELSEYKECFIGHDEVFQRAGALVELAFEAEVCFRKDKKVPQEKRELKLIQKRQKESAHSTDEPVYIQEVGFSYYNGLGWKRLFLKAEEPHLFSKDGKRRCRLRFFCPPDWKPVIVGGSELRCLRIQILRADSCYKPEARHHTPVLQNIRLSYSYGKNGVRPQTLLRVQGGHTEPLLPEIISGGLRGTPLFLPFPYRGESMLFGFDRVFPAGKISLYLVMEEQTQHPPMQVQFEYSGVGGFQRLPVSDGTDGLTRSGLVFFWLPEDAKETEVQGKRRFWLRIVRNEETKKQQLPKLRMLYLNGVEACNYEWTKVKEYYLDAPTPHFCCKVPGERILDAEVWVNEADSLSEEEKSQMLSGSFGKDGKIQAERDFQGKISEFFVLWEEVFDFSKTGGGKRGYLLDREKKEVRFGDGKIWKIPECLSGTAIRIRTRVCDGQQGNLRKMTTYEPAVSQTFLRKIFQPLPAYGGTEPESREHMKQRGELEVNSGNRLISRMDFQNRIRTCSEQIARTRFIKEADGQEKLVVLMKDFTDGPASFQRIKPVLTEATQRLCGIAAERHKTQLVEPVFVRVSVEVWLEGTQKERFRYEQEIQKRLRQYFLPDSYWKIGTLPDRTDLETVLRLKDASVRVRYFNAVFSYRDGAGVHCWNLGDNRVILEAVCVNGNHRIHWVQKEERQNVETKRRRV